MQVVISQISGVHNKKLTVRDSFVFKSSCSWPFIPFSLVCSSRVFLFWGAKLCSIIWIKNISAQLIFLRQLFNYENWYVSILTVHSDTKGMLDSVVEYVIKTTFDFTSSPEHCTKNEVFQ